MEEQSSKQPLYVTSEDAARLHRLLDAKEHGAEQHPLHALVDALGRAVVVPGSDLPGYVVTMNSRVRLKDLDTGTVGEYTLVYPGGADIGQGKMSVLAPVGAALLGRQELDTVTCRVPAGRKRFRIEQVLYQPEAVATASRRSPRRAGRYDTPSAIARVLQTERPRLTRGKLEA